MATRLQRLREAAGLTQQALAERAGVSLHTYLNWEWGRRTPLADAMEKLADALDISLDELYGRTWPRRR